MLKLFIITLSLWASADFLTPMGLNFEDKNLQKELLKISEATNNKWKDLNIPVSDQDANRIQGKFMILSGVNAMQKQYAYVGRVNSCRQGGCSNPSINQSFENSEYFDYLIVFDEKPSVKLVKVYNYQATHGQEISVKGWLKQFTGFDGNTQLSVGKSIDAISGATISVYAITNDIQEKTRLLKRIIGPHN